MMRSLYSGVSGLKNHQTRMDVIGNNIANVNTTAFKSSRVIFQDIYSQTSRSASGGTPDVVGGTNPMQIGLGVTLANIDTFFNSAATQRTDNPTDLCIEGDGFFVIRNASGETLYTRAGNLYVDNAGNLVTASGMFVMGKNGSTKPTSYSGVSDTEIINLDGYYNISIDQEGVIKGYPKTTTPGTDAVLETIGFIPLATFSNNAGLEKVGNSLYKETSNSGPVTINNALEGGSGRMNPGGLEMSNTDLSSEFTDMIVTQRGFQANSRIITVSDTLLEELINLKR